MIRLILLFSLLFFYSHTEANDGSENDLFEILKDFKLKDGEDYNRQVSSFYLDDASKNKGYKLKIDSKGSFSLFINDNIQYMGNSMTINIDSLFKAVSLPIISFSLYGKKEIKFELVQNPVKNGLSEKPAKLSDTVDFSLNNFIIFSIFCLSILVAIIKTKYNKTYNEFFLLQRILAAKDKEEEIFKYRFLSNQVLLFALLFSLIVSSLIIISYNLNDDKSTDLFLFRSAPFFWMVLKWIGLSLIVYLSVIVKYILITIFTGIFKIKAYRSNHFLNYLRFSSLFFGIVLLLQCLVYFGGNSEFLFNNILSIGVFIMITRSMVIFMKLINYFGNRVLHLFSYLCATELIPLIFIVFLTRMLLSI